MTRFRLGTLKMFKIPSDGCKISAQGTEIFLASLLLPEVLKEKSLLRFVSMHVQSKCAIVSGKIS